MNTWKKMRMAHIMDGKSGNTIIVPMDHHGTTIPAQEWIEDPAKIVKNVVDGKPDAILAHMGTIMHGYVPTSIGSGVGTILHMCVATWLSPEPNRKVIVNTLKTAIAMWVDAVSTHVNFGINEETDMLQDLALLANECIEWGMPLLGMMYIKGHDVKPNDAQAIAHTARIAAEVGCDLVKVPYAGSIEWMQKVVKSTPIPVVIAWGSKLSDLQALEMVCDAMSAGCKWLSMGRNIFQRENPAKFLSALKVAVHEWKNFDDAKKLLD